MGYLSGVNTHKYNTPTPRLKADPAERIKLTALFVVRFQNTVKRKTTAGGGAKKPSTEWNTSKRFNPLMLSIANAIPIANIQPAIMVIRPTRIRSLLVAFGFIFFA